MPRKKITSTTQLKAERQLKRAVKRGDGPPPDPTAKKKKRPRKGVSNRLLGPTPLNAISNIENSRKLQSTFIKLPPTFLEDTKYLANTLILPRPITKEAARLESSKTGGDNDAMVNQLTCPRRPKWRFDQSKIEVEKHEEGMHKKWIAQMDQIVEDWQKDGDAISEDETDPEVTQPKPVTQMPRSPTYFERNLEVWRQLWRVTEISQIILVLLDSRCPLLHFPSSLAAYLSNRRVILVLTKVDISGPTRAAAWTRYFHDYYPDLPIVQVEAYAEKTAGIHHQGKAHFEPHLSETFKERLVQVIREVHGRMLEPPESMKGNEHKYKWVSPVKREIDWEGVLRAGGEQVGSAVGGALEPRPKVNDEEPDESTGQKLVEPEFLTIGLIGQPNVGKSSLLNALFGTHKVRASKTPGKTKHFQTLFWTPDVRLVDCPGLVMPNFVPMEMQVLSGTLPISRVSAIPACIHYICQYLPLEKIFDLAHPSLTVQPVEDNRTWRGGTRPGISETKDPAVLTWTAADVLTAYANKKGWVTAQAGRPDVGRAGNALLRATAEGKVRWAFWPPNIENEAMDGEDGAGIWISSPTGENGESGVEDDSEDEELTTWKSNGSDDVLNSDEEEEIEEEKVVSLKTTGIGRFEALALDEEADLSENGETGESEE